MAALKHIVSDATSGAPDTVARAEHRRWVELGAFGGVVMGILGGAVLWLGILGIVLGQR